MASLEKMTVDIDAVLHTRIAGDGTEKRYSNRRPTVERRGDGDESQTVISGHAAVYYRAGDEGTEYKIFDDLIERIMPGAFDRAIAEEHDVRGKYNHTQLLGRVKSGTTRVSVDAVGLRYEIDTPDSATDVIESIRRGDVDGSSFAFIVREQIWREIDGVDYREILDVDLFDVGPVDDPAYTGTTTGLRNIEDAYDAIAARDAWRAEKRQAEEKKTAAAASPDGPDVTAKQSSSANAKAKRTRLVEIEAAGGTRGKVKHPQN